MLDLHRVGLQPEEMKEILADVKYKPKWALDIIEVPTYGRNFWLMISFRAIDAFATGDTASEVKIGMRYVIPFHIANEDHFLQWVFDRIMEAEKHEAQEFFKYKDVMIYDPHKRER